MTFPGKTV